MEKNAAGRQALPSSTQTEFSNHQTVLTSPAKTTVASKLEILIISSRYFHFWHLFRTKTISLIDKVTRRSHAKGLSHLSLLDNTMFGHDNSDCHGVCYYPLSLNFPAP